MEHRGKGKLIAASSLAALGGVAAIALGSQPGTSAVEAAATEPSKPKVQTEVVHRVKHVQAKASTASAASGSSAPASAAAPVAVSAPAAASAPAPEPVSAPAPAAEAPVGDDYEDDDAYEDDSSEEEDDSYEDDGEDGGGEDVDDD